jgi:DNA repair exonuclease SbcCD ATPase subunit
MENQTPKKRDNNKIYFLIAVIIALLATNVYFFMEKNKSEEKIIVVSNDKTALETELQKLETELEQANSSTTEISEELKVKDEELKLKIVQLRTALNKGELTAKDLVKAREDIKQLRYFVTKYTADIDKLQQQNAALTGERDSLKTTVSNVKQLATNLSKANDSLNVKVKAGAALKTSGLQIAAFRSRTSGKEVAVTKANTAKKIKVAFTINTNPIAEKGTHSVFMRILDPSGNLIIGEGGSFEANNQQLQYTYKTAIEFSGEAKTFTLDWNNAATFQSGNYTVILYADGYTMGKGTFNLK